MNARKRTRLTIEDQAHHDDTQCTARAQRGDGIEDADEVGCHVALLFAVLSEARAVILGPEAPRLLLALALVFLARVPRTVFVDFEHGFLGQLPESTSAAGNRRSIGHARGDPAQVHHVGHAARRVGPATETEQIDPVARLIRLDDRFIAIGDVVADAGPERRSEDTRNLLQPIRAGLPGAQTSVVGRDLLGRVYVGVDARARCTIQLVDVGQALIGLEPTELTGSVGEDQDILAHLVFIGPDHIRNKACDV